VAVALSGCGETAESYCGNLYHDGGGGTPEWARKDSLFSDYQSCREWYWDGKEQAR
jgi:hypothetical protein